MRIFKIILNIKKNFICIFNSKLMGPSFVFTKNNLRSESALRNV